jgi:hypothetical protein
MGSFVQARSEESPPRPIHGPPSLAGLDVVIINIMIASRRRRRNAIYHSAECKWHPP